VLIEKSKTKDQITSNGTTWGDIDGRELTFLTPNRPAKRYLYLRYVITYLHHKKTGNSEWLEQAMSNSNARGYMWATPGPYLRRSMLVVLARRVSDNFLPEALYDQTTFDDADSCPSRSAEEEEDLVMGLNVRIEDAFREAREILEEESESDSGSHEEE
jgi:hypothetical protein